MDPRIEPLLHVQTGTDPAGKPSLSWQRDQSLITTAARFDGLYALATNLPAPLTATNVLDIYTDQWIVEQRHRDLKRATPLRVRPVFLHNDDASRPSSASSASPCSSSASSKPTCATDCQPAKNNSPDYSRKAAPPNPPAATSSRPSTASASPTPPPAPSWTTSHPPNDRSWPYSTSPYRGSNEPSRHPTVRKTRLAEG
jgi:hypothetical protein